MGEKNEAILSYLEDNARFADLMNGAVFGGVQAVDPGQLEDASEHYTEKEGKGRNIKYRGRTRDIPAGQKRREHSAAGGAGSPGNGGLRNAASLHEL